MRRVALRGVIGAIPGVVGLALAHFFVWIAFAMLTHGTDLDQLRSRSPASRASGVIYDVLSFPHDTILRAIPVRWIQAGAAPAVIVAGSLAWGVALQAAWVLASRRRHAPGGAPP